MRRTILGLAAAALVTFFAADASACHHKKACATPCEPVCAPVCEPVCAPVKKCHFSMPKICLPKFHMPKLCHKRACAPVCAPAPCNTCNEVVWAAPQATPQSVPTSQSLPVPQK